MPVLKVTYIIPHPQMNLRELHLREEEVIGEQVWLAVRPLLTALLQARVL